MRRAPRGQAVAEAALGILVMVTVLVFAIHLAEVGYLSLKVQESAVSALWDSTQGEVHEMPGLTNLNGEFDTGPAVAAAQADAQDRYRDFDGRTFVVRSDSVTNVFTQANGLQVRCTQDAPDFNLPFPFQLVGMGSGSLTLLRDGGGASCTASATLDAWAFPNRFQESGDGYFRVQHRAFASPMTICAVGRAWNGGCSGQFSTMLDEWSFSHGNEAADCTIVPGTYGPCQNHQYWYTANMMYQASSMLPTPIPFGAASRMAEQVVGSSPISSGGLLGGVGLGGLGGLGGVGGFVGGLLGNTEDAFWMSATVMMPGHLQPNHPLPHDALPNPLAIIFPVTPGKESIPVLYAPPSYRAAGNNRRPCFLGRPCE